MTVNIFDLDAVHGSEDLSVGERIKLLISEFSLGIDKFNAKHFNKSIHVVDFQNLPARLKAKNNYFKVSFKHIPSPVFFNPKVTTFNDYVHLILQGIGALKLANTQAEDLYRGLKTLAAKGQVVHSIRNSQLVVTLNQLRDQVQEKITDTKTYNRPVQDHYKNWEEFDQIGKMFNAEVGTLQSRDTEILAKNMDNCISVLRLVKDKVDRSEIILNDIERTNLNEAIQQMDSNAKLVGELLSYIAELKAVFEQQIPQLLKM
ncbi:putative virion structural protein [Aeromonas phage ZPAH34]|uniref:putative virion structural protein n=1 Tax=Aeromonas phage ZPAH34 TaxID=2924888 RepID=UPI00232990B8|nr:putative virion structural protein [Aeromonas phage ZPAH34]UOX39491.1 putative virion structural protein [Aeromonas phage ZPAH34]